MKENFDEPLTSRTENEIIMKIPESKNSSFVSNNDNWFAEKNHLKNFEKQVLDYEILEELNDIQLNTETYVTGIFFT